MATTTQSTRRKLSLLKLAEELGNVSRACHMVSYHRETPSTRSASPSKPEAGPALVEYRRGPR